jgi:Carbonic anhydrase
MEFACAVSGAKVVFVLGHTACGGIKGAIDDVDLDNLTGLLARIKPATTATEFDGEKSSTNPAYVDPVARAKVDLAWPKSAEEARFWKLLRKRAPSRSLAGCITWARVWWSF